MPVNKMKSKLADTNQIAQIVDAQTHIADPTGGVTTDAEARAAIVSILNALEAHGLVKEA